MQTIHLDHPCYPAMLKGHRKAPLQIYIDGDPALLNMPSIAIVGTRNATERAARIAYCIAAFFASQGYVILSGLALGIDTAAHEGALSIPGGKTLAVLATQIGSIYPPENKGLADRIVAGGGLLMTEYASNAYAPYQFVARDYLQALLSLAVIPVQADVSSGTRHACNAALREKRHLFVPMPVPKDEEQYPERYRLIRLLMAKPECVVFHGKQDYPKLLERLKS